MNTSRYMQIAFSKAKQPNKNKPKQQKGDNLNFVVPLNWFSSLGHKGQGQQSAKGTRRENKTEAPKKGQMSSYASTVQPHGKTLRGHQVSATQQP